MNYTRILSISSHQWPFPDIELKKNEPQSQKQKPNWYETENNVLVIIQLIIFKIIQLIVKLTWTNELIPHAS